MFTNIRIKVLLFVFTAMLARTSILAQNIGIMQTDSLHRELLQARHDTSRILIMCSLAEAYRTASVDTTLFFATEALGLSRQYNFPKGESKALSSLCSYFYTTGNYPAALDAGLKAFKKAQEYNLRYDQAFAMIRIGNVYVAMNDLRSGLRFYEDTRALVRNTPDSFFYAVTFWLSADVYEKLNKPDSALTMAMYAQDTATKMNNTLILFGLNRILGNIYARKGDKEKALEYYHKRLPDALRGRLVPSNAEACFDLAKYHFANHQPDSATMYATKAYELSTAMRNAKIRYSSAEILSRLLDSQNVQKSHQYLLIANAIRDSLFGVEKLQELQAISYREKERQNELRLTETKYRSNIRQFALLSGLVLLILISLGLYRSARSKSEPGFA
jgi:two-component system, NtrC family, sensor kinase